MKTRLSGGQDVGAVDEGTGIVKEAGELFLTPGFGAAGAGGDEENEEGRFVECGEEAVGYGAGAGFGIV